MTKKRYTTQWFKQRVFKLTKYDYTVLGKYIKANIKIRIRHNICGHTFRMRPYSFLSGERCPHCSKIKRRFSELKSNQWFRDKFNKRKDSNEYIILSKYKGSSRRIKLYHKICGYTWTPKAYVTINKHYESCPYCNGTHRKSTKEYNHDVYKVLGKNYISVTKYIKYNSYIYMKHLVCGHTWKTTPHEVLQGYGCPYCHKSLGEYYVCCWLSNHNIIYKYPLIIKSKDTRINNLHLDFFIPKLRIAIEYDGVQHFTPQKYFGGIEKFNIQKQHDLLKNLWCKLHHIKLIRIEDVSKHKRNYKRKLVNNVLNKRIEAKL